MAIVGTDPNETREALWIRCNIAPSFKQEEALVQIDVENVDDPVGFFVLREVVRPQDVSEPDTQGTVRVSLVERQNGHVVIDVPGEPISFGPRISVSSDLIAKEAS